MIRWHEWCDTKLPLYLAGLCYALLQDPSPGWPRLGAVVVPYSHALFRA